MADGMQGWAALGEMAAGNIGTPGVYEDALSGEYKREYELQRAREKRGEAIRSLLAADYYKKLPGMGDELGRTPAEMAVIAAGGGNAPQLASALGAFQEQGFRGSAADAALGGDYDAANAHLFGVASGPVRVNEITGGVATNPYDTDAAIRMTPLGEVAAGLDAARAVSELAQADANTALAEKRRRIDAGAATEGLPDAPPVPGARLAPDGKWYVQKGGKTFLVEP